jgi:hypothetical protein
MVTVGNFWPHATFVMAECWKPLLIGENADSAGGCEFKQQSADH